MRTIWIFTFLCGATVLATGMRTAADEPDSEVSEAEAAERYAAVTEAVAANPEMAVEIAGELSRNFPESAPSIVVSAIEGLPESDQDLVDAIVAAAVNAAPDQQAAIEQAAARFREDEERTVEEELEVESVTDTTEAEASDQPAGEAGEPEVEVASEAAESEVTDGSVPRSDEEGVEEEAVRVDLSEIERPERLAREVTLMESLMNTFPERIPATVRRSVGRVADEEWYWSAVLAKAAIDKAPDLEESIMAEAIAAAPHHEEAIRSAILEPAVEEEEAELVEAESVGEDPMEAVAEDDVEEDLPERLLREIRLIESLAGTFPENAPDAVRRSLGRVSDEEAYWTVAVVQAAITELPDRKSEIIESAVAAAPQHEEEIRGLLDAKEEPDATTVAEKEEDAVPEPFTLANATESIELTQDRLTVRFEVFPTEPTRARIAIESLELSIRPHRYFDPYQGRYLERDMATITGDGIVGLVFRVGPDDSKQITALAEVMETFLRMADEARDFVAATMEETESGLLLDEVRTEIGGVYFYPSRREFSAQFDGDFRDHTYRLRIGGAVSLTRDTVPAIRHLLEHLPRYQEEYRSRLDARERQIEAFHQFTQKPIRESAKEEDKEES